MNIFQRIAAKALSRLTGIETDNPLYRASTSSRLQGFNRILGMPAQNDDLILREGYAKSSDVYAIINKITKGLKKLDWKVEVQTRDGWEETTDSQWNDLLKAPNKLTTWRGLIEEYATYYLLLGHSYIYKSEAVGFPGIAELTTMPADKVDIVAGDYINPIKGFELEEINNSFIPYDKMLFQKMCNPVGTFEERLYGMSPIRAAWYVVQSGNNAWEANGSILKNRGASGILTSEADFPLTDEEIDQIESVWNKRNSGADKFGKITFGGNKVNYTSIGMSPNDLKLIEMSIIPLRTLCSVYGIDSEVLNDTASSTYNNRKEAEKALFEDTVLPLADTIKDGLNMCVTPELVDGERLRLTYSTKNISALQADKEKQSNIAVNLVNSGIWTQNEAREYMGSEPMTGEEYDTLKNNSTQSNTTNNENI